MSGVRITAQIRIAGLLILLFATAAVGRADHIRELQTRAIEQGRADFGHWGWKSDDYTQWATHSNRLIPVYTFGTRGAGAGIDLDDYTGTKSPYRNAAALRKIYGFLPTETLSDDADYLDQTNIYDIQQAALAAGKKHIILVVFDGMDWETTRAASIWNLQRVAYNMGRGTGTHFQDYTAGGTSQFGFMVTAPHNNGTAFDVDAQTVKNPGGTHRGGYDSARGGAAPWSVCSDPEYAISLPKEASNRHPYTDSSSSAVSMTAGIKTYNGAVNVGPAGEPVATIAHHAQAAGYRVGAVSSVPISHATPAAAYAHNVTRGDYQDISRDLLGLPSVSHPDQPLPGMDVVIGGGFGGRRDKDAGQGENYVPGNRYLADSDLESLRQDGRYEIAVRQSGQAGARQLRQAAERAVQSKKRLLGFYGIGAASGHLPFATADGDYRPAIGRNKSAEIYTQADREENPTLAEMTAAALHVLGAGNRSFWLMIEAGDVDWANHDNNIDNSIGAVNSGDAAIRVATNWIEQHSSWKEALLIVTADHGHYLHLTRPELLIAPTEAAVRPE